LNRWCFDSEGRDENAGGMEKWRWERR